MSFLLLDFTKSFISGRLPAAVFADAYIELWRIERDNKNILDYEKNLSECLSSIFCLADMYNPDEDRDEYELDDDHLWDEVNKLVNNYLSK